MPSSSGVKAGKAFVLIEAIDKTSYILNRISKKLNNFAAKMTDIGRRAIMGATLAGLPLALSAKVFADFDDQMRTVAAVSQADAAAFARLSTEAKRLGRTTSFTAVQVASLMVELGKAGFNPAQIEQATAAVLDLARASGTDPTLSSGIMATTLQQFGLGADQARRVADVLTLTANATFNSVEQLGESLSYAGPVAADFNMTLEDTLAVLGALGNVGILGSSAGTAVRRLLTLSAAEAQKLEGIFGVKFQDAGKNARPLIDVLGEINEATKNMGTAERAAKFNEAFGLLGITAASALGKVSVDVKKLQQDLMNAAGVAAKTAKQMDAGPGGVYRRIKAGIEGIALAIGGALTPLIMPLGGLITTLLGKFAEWIVANQVLVAGIALAVGVVGTFGVAMFALGVAVKLASIALAGMAFILGLVKGLMLLISSPIFLTIAAIVAIGAAILLLSTRVQDLVGGAINELGAAFMRAFAIVKKAWAGISEALAAGDTATAMKLAGLAVAAVWAQVMEMLKNGLLSVSLDAYRVWLDIAAGFSKAMNAAIEFVQKRLVDLLVMYLKLEGMITGRDMSAAIFAVELGFKTAAATQRQKADQQVDHDQEIKRAALAAIEIAMRTKNAVDRKKAEDALDKALALQKAIKALQTISMWGWLGPGRKATGAKSPPGSTDSNQRKPLEALQGLEKGTLEAAKAFIEARSQNDPALKIARDQLTAQQQIAANTGRPPIEIEVVG
jgi:TP901 family phage tail tape measure protein